MKRALVLAACLTLTVAACSRQAATQAPAPTPAEDPVATYVRVYGGLEGVYRSILAEDGCDALQEQFWTATENNSLGYQAAIGDRAEVLDCPPLTFTRP